MASVVRPLVWFYHEFGLKSINETGRNAWLIVLARSLRMFAYGTNSLILALFFSELGFSDSRIGKASLRSKASKQASLTSPYRSVHDIDAVS